MTVQMNTKTPTLIVFVIFSMFCLSYLSVHASAVEDFETTPTTLFPDADAYVNSFCPDKNYDEYPVLEMGRNGCEKSVFIKFNLFQIPADATIADAQLMMYGFSANTGIVSVYYVPDDSWTEKGITYSNRPSSSIYITDKENVSLKSWCSWDIKEDVITALSDNKILTVVMRYETEEDSEGANFFPRECLNEKIRPKLVITYTIPTSPIPIITPPPIPTNASTAASLGEKQLWWTKFGVAATIGTPFVTYLLYRFAKKSRRKPEY